MVTTELLDYINRARAAGQTDEQIAQGLIRQGWQQPDIQSALANNQPSPVPSQPTPQPILGQTSQEKLWFETAWVGILLPLLFSWIGVATLVFLYWRSKRRMPLVLRIWLIIQGLLIPLILGAALFAAISTRIQQRNSAKPTPADGLSRVLPSPKITPGPDSKTISIGSKVIDEYGFLLSVPSEWYVRAEAPAPFIKALYVSKEKIEKPTDVFTVGITAYRINDIQAAAKEFSDFAAVKNSVNPALDYIDAYVGNRQRQSGNQARLHSKTWGMTKQGKGYYLAEITLQTQGFPYASREFLITGYDRGEFVSVVMEAKEDEFLKIYKPVFEQIVKEMELFGG